MTDSPIAGMTMSTVAPAARLGLVRRAGSAVAGRLRGAAGAVAVGGDLGEHGADGHGVALGGVDLHDGAGGRGGDLGVDLVGRDLDEGLVLGDRVALLLVPFQDGALGDRVAHRRHDDFDRRVDRHQVRPTITAFRLPLRGLGASSTTNPTLPANGPTPPTTATMTAEPERDDAPPQRRRCTAAT